MILFFFPNLIYSTLFVCFLLLLPIEKFSCVVKVTRECHWFLFFFSVSQSINQFFFPSKASPLLKFQLCNRPIGCQMSSRSGSIQLNQLQWSWLNRWCFGVVQVLKHQGFNTYQGSQNGSIELIHWLGITVNL